VKPITLAQPGGTAESIRKTDAGLTERQTEAGNDTRGRVACARGPFRRTLNCSLQHLVV